jgi:hypothetical protein
MISKPTRKSPTQAFLTGKRKAKSKKTTKKLEQQVSVPKDSSNQVSISWLKPVLNEALEREQKLWEPPLRSFRGSATGTACVRALTFNALGHRVPFEARVLRIFATGKKIEEVIIEAAVKAKVLVPKSDQQGGEYTDPPITCHVDGVVIQPGENLCFLLEIKSINERAFDMLPLEHDITEAGKSPLMARYVNYVTQWNTYAWSPGIDLVYGALFFEAKNTQRQKLYGLMRDVLLLDETLARHSEAAQYVLSDPQRIAPVPKKASPKKGSGDCQKCDHRYLCKVLPQKEVEYDKVRAVDAKLRG